jgi:hypothetical protein
VYKYIYICYETQYTRLQVTTSFLASSFSLFWNESACTGAFTNVDHFRCPKTLTSQGCSGPAEVWMDSGSHGSSFSMASIAFPQVVIVPRNVLKAVDGCGTKVDHG